MPRGEAIREATRELHEWGKAHVGGFTGLTVSGGRVTMPDSLITEATIGEIREGEAKRGGTESG